MSVLLEWAFASSLLALAVFGVRALLKGKISLRARYALWLLLAVRLLVPVRLPFALPAALPEASRILSEDAVFLERPASPETAAVSGDPHRHPVPDEETGEVHACFGGSTVDDMIRTAVLVLWGQGAVCVILAVVWFNLRFWRRLRLRREPLTLEDWPLPVYAADGLPSPCLFGLFRPAVYLTPETAEDEKIRTHVLAHELTHYAHRDHLWAAVRCLCLALHWYNPLVWLAASLSKRDGELACDEGAVARLGEGERVPYGMTLVGLVARRTAPADLFSCSTAMTGGKTAIRQRVELLVRKPQTVKTALFAAVSLLSLCLVFVFAKGADTQSEYQKFMGRVESAQSIRVGQPIYSSIAYPAPITDAELLIRAREVLTQAEEVGDPEALREDFSQANLFAQTIIFYSLPDGPGTAYRFYTTRSACYVAPAGEAWDDPFVPFATLSWLAVDLLGEYAGQQQYWTQAETLMDGLALRLVRRDGVDYSPYYAERPVLSVPLTHTQGDRALLVVQDTGESHPSGLSDLIIGVWDTAEQDFVGESYLCVGDEGLYSAWTTEDGALYFLCANSTTYQGFTTGRPPLWLKFENGELTRLTALPDIARASGVELPSDEIFWNDRDGYVSRYTGYVSYWYDHTIIPDGSGFTLCRRTPDWDNIGFEDVPQWRKLGYVPLA